MPAYLLLRCLVECDIDFTGLLKHSITSCAFAVSHSKYKASMQGYSRNRTDPEMQVPATSAVAIFPCLCKRHTTPSLQFPLTPMHAKLFVNTA